MTVELEMPFESLSPKQGTQPEALSAVQETVGSIIQPCQINVAILGKQIA